MIKIIVVRQEKSLELRHERSIYIDTSFFKLNLDNLICGRSSLEIYYSTIKEITFFNLATYTGPFNYAKISLILDFYYKNALDELSQENLEKLLEG